MIESKKSSRMLPREYTPGLNKRRPFPGIHNPECAAVVTETVTVVANVPLSVTGLGDTMHVAFGMAATGAQVSVTDPENA